MARVSHLQQPQYEGVTLLDLAQVVKALVDELYPDAKQLVPVVDNLNIHHPAALYERITPGEARRVADQLEWRFATKLRYQDRRSR